MSGCSYNIKIKIFILTKSVITEGNGRIHDQMHFFVIKSPMVYNSQLISNEYAKGVLHD